MRASEARGRDPGDKGGVERLTGCRFPGSIDRRSGSVQHAGLHSLGEAMLKRIFLATALVAAPALAQGPAEVTLARLDCGTGAKPVNIAERFSDTFAYSADKQLQFTYSCYVIKHGNDYMVWDTGFVPGSNPNAPKVSLTDQLAQLKVTPDQVKYVGISHFHADHTSQLPSLPGATLLIGQREWEALTAPKPMQGANVEAFKHWI